MTVTVFGTDVSNWQPDSYGTSYNGYPIYFAFVKTTEGITYVNEKVIQQVAHARSKGIVVGHYHFMHAGNPHAQLDYFVQTLKLNKLYKPGDLIALDWESYTSGGKTYHANNADKDAWLHYALQAFPESQVVLYCNKYDWTHLDSTSVCGNGLWIAAPSDPDGQPGIEHPWVIQQIAVKNNQDWNCANFKSRDEFVRWARAKVKAVTDVATKSTTYKEVWDADVAIPPSGHATTENPKWKPISILTGIYEQIELLRKQVSELENKVDSL